MRLTWLKFRREFASEWLSFQNESTLGLQSASDQDIWNRAKSDGYVVVTRDADFQELSLVWGSPPQVVRLRTPNLNRASVLEMLLDHKDQIHHALEIEGMSSIELIAQPQGG